MGTSPDEVTAARAALLLGLSERTIRRRIAAGEIPARRIAANRFAINVHDLPAQRSPETLAARIEALEHRVRLLELHQEGGQPPETPPAESGRDAATMATLQSLLAQLARETERLAPLVTPPDMLSAKQRRRTQHSTEPRQIETARETGNG